MDKSMFLITSEWDGMRSFRMIPLTNNCPYVECIFDPVAKVLAVIGKDKKQSLHMVPKLDHNGDLDRLKMARRANGKDYPEERKVLETYYEYHLTNPDEIRRFIWMIAMNDDTFPYEEMIVEKQSTEVNS